MSSAASSRSRIADARWWQFPVATALLLLGVLAAGLEPHALPLVYLAAVTPALCVSDLTERRLPNRLVLPGYPLAFLGIGAQWLATGQTPWVALVAGAGYFGFLLIPGLLGGMGMGDVKLAGVLGLAAGALGPTTAVVAPVLAFLLGGVVAVVILARGRRGGIPFGPFLLAGFWLAVALG